MKHLIFILLSIVLIISCNSEENDNNISTSEDTVIVEENLTDKKPVEKPELLLETINSEEIVQTKLTSEFKGEKIDLYICEGGLSKVSKEDVFLVDIPENAEQIISVFHAGLSTTIYLIEEDTKFVVHIIKQDESGESEEKVLTVFEK